jgi:spore coat polysaccharide biosynthesis protein SpsF (cytidylyltransferase family)
MIGGLVHARMTSERLPGKPLAEICGRAAILHLADRMTACRYLTRDRIVLCTTTDPRDDVLAATVSRAGFQVFRGSTHDIVDRFYRAAAEHGFDAVVQVDGDDVCADPGYMDRVLDALLANPEVDVVLADGLPLGVASKAISFRALERVHQAYVPGDNSTGASYYFTRSGLCRVARIEADAADRHDTARLTLDEPADLAFFRAVFDHLHAPPMVFSVAQIVALLREHPELLELNSGLTDDYFARSDEHVRREQLRFRTPEGIREVSLT